MLRIRHLKRLPDNFNAFVDEVADGLGQMYGLPAGAHYRKQARQRFLAHIHHPSVLVLGAHDGESTTGLLLAGEGAVGEIFFLHILAAHAGKGIESRLLEEAVRIFRNGGVDGVVCECVNFCTLDLHDTLAHLGFRNFERELMVRPMASTAPALISGLPIQPLEEGNWDAAATCLFEAYKDHVGAALHQEVRNKTCALDFLRRASKGAYGLVAPDYLQAAWNGRRCAGLVAGCEVAPSVGFVLQLAVHPEMRRKGLGTQLLFVLSKVFEDLGAKSLALGVTLDTPAHEMYQGLGFKHLKGIDAYAWWRP